MTKQLQPPHYKAKEQRLRIPEERCWLPYRVCNMKDRLFPTPQQTLLCLCKKKKKCALAPLVTDRVLCSSVQFTHSVVSDSLRPHGLQHATLPCPSPTPGAYSNSCPSRWRCHPTISSSGMSKSEWCKKWAELDTSCVLFEILLPFITAVTNSLGQSSTSFAQM